MERSPTRAPLSLLENELSVLLNATIGKFQTLRASIEAKMRDRYGTDAAA